MEDSNNITYNEWKLKNPSGSLNEYYSIHKIKPLNSNNTYVISNKAEETIDTRSFESNKLIFAGIISAIGIIGYFSPWFTIPLFNISISGNDLRQLSTIVLKFVKVNQNSMVLKYSWIIPCGYIIFFIGNLLKSFLITFLGALVSIAFFILVTITLYNSPIEIINFISIGFYLLFVNFFILIYYIFKF